MNRYLSFDLRACICAYLPLNMFVVNIQNKDYYLHRFHLRYGKKLCERDATDEQIRAMYMIRAATEYYELSDNSSKYLMPKYFAFLAAKGNYWETLEYMTELEEIIQAEYRFPSFRRPYYLAPTLFKLAIDADAVKFMTRLFTLYYDSDMEHTPYYENGKLTNISVKSKEMCELLLSPPTRSGICAPLYDLVVRYLPVTDCKKLLVMRLNNVIEEALLCTKNPEKMKLANNNNYYKYVTNDKSIAAGFNSDFTALVHLADNCIEEIIEDYFLYLITGTHIVNKLK